jgi:hypothetical protein
MNYREKILELICSDDDTAFFTWLEQQPLILQPDIMREFEAIARMVAEEMGDDAMMKEVESYATRIENYEEAIQEEQLASVQTMLAVQARDEALQQMENDLYGSRQYIIGCIINQEPNAKDMLELARKLIDLEKKDGYHDPEKWKAISHLL